VILFPPSYIGLLLVSSRILMVAEVVFIIQSSMHIFIGFHLKCDSIIPSYVGLLLVSSRLPMIAEVSEIIVHYISLFIFLDMFQNVWCSWVILPTSPSLGLSFVFDAWLHLFANIERTPVFLLKNMMWPRIIICMFMYVLFLLLFYSTC
jgi:hypothetical protein